MSNKNIIEETLKWVSTLPYWVQFVADKIIKEEEIMEKLIKKTYDLFLEDNELKEITLKRENIELQSNETHSQSAIDDLILLEVKNVNNVNAIAENQRIDFSKNMTVVYGANGSGKSGYVRLFNNVFISRGDKNILPNIFNTTGETNPSGIFGFQSDSEHYELKFPEDKNRGEFKYFSVFDNKSVRAHLDERNELFFTPHGFEFFSKLAEVYKKIKELLKEDINKNSPENQFRLHFNSESEIKQVVDNLNASTDIEKLKKIAEFTENDKKTLDELGVKKGELLATDIDKKIAELNNIKKSIDEFKEKITHILNNLSESDTIKTDISDLIQKEKLANQSGIDKFQTKLIKETGSREWKNFIESAYEFAKLQYPDNPDKVLYPEGKDHCIFCLQPLSDEAQNLIANYWDFLISTAEEEAKKSLQKIQRHKTDIEEIDFNLLQDDSILVQWINAKDEQIVKKWKQKIDGLEKQRDLILENLMNKNWENTVTSVKFDLVEIDIYTDEIQNKINELQKQNPKEEIQKIEKQIIFLKHKILLKQLLPSILEFIKKHKWAKKANSSISNLNTIGITSKQTEFFKTFITERYKEIFNEECKKLEANFGIEIGQKGQLGKTYRQLRIEGYDPKNVLSEGEQRAISLADFLTEIQISEFNKGIIFDDPVNSLDHERKKGIAQRIADESKNRQVIVFTHDLLFLYYLKNSVSDLNIDFKCHWMEKRKSIPGNIFLDNSPATENDYKTTNKAREYYEKSKNAPPQKREHLLEQGFGALRTNYEYFVVFNLFENVVSRFDERISIDRLKDCILPEDIVQQVIEKTGELSRYIEPHLHSDNYAANKPTPELLKKEIEEFISIRNNLKKKKKEKSKQ
ncbi:MAG: hypothetical protein A7315_09190 [Candidatus Altiarchaeales archaeon WOR_SM1_79]|nr:MAG: hypothetical protein A7315_09190 [Candidatus Altiarchaeales archaeon WOR_SM1_79]